MDQKYTLNTTATGTNPGNHPQYLRNMTVSFAKTCTSNILLKKNKKNRIYIYNNFTL